MILFLWITVFVMALCLVLIAGRLVFMVSDWMLLKVLSKRLEREAIEGGPST